MTSPRALAAALLVAAAAPAAAVDWYGFADLGFVRNDTWSSAAHAAQPAWDFGGQLAFSAAPLRPGLLTVGGNANYRQSRSQYSHSSSRGDSYGYSLAANALNEKPLSLSLSATRGWSDFTTDAAATTTGSTLSQSEIVTATYSAERRPTLRASVSMNEYENRSFASEPVTGASTSLSMSASQTLQNQSYAASYDTGWNEGSYSETNYRSHFVTLQATSSLPGDAEVRITERYFLRDPTLLADTNPRFDDNAFGASASWHASKRTHGHVDYAYRHLLVDLPISADRESLGHSASTGVDHRLTDSVTVGSGVSGSYGRDRLADRVVEISGQNGTLSARWQRVVGRGGSVFVATNGSAGAQQQRERGNDLAYGGAATAGASAAWSRMNASVTAGTSYSENLGATLGWAVAHHLGAQLDGASPLGGRMRNTLSAALTRRGHPLFGDSRSETLTASVGNAWRTRELQLSAGLTNGASRTIGSPVGGDFVLPSELQTQSRFLTLSLSKTSGRLGWTALARHLSTTSPGRPTASESGVGLTVTYRLGAFVFALDERYSVGSTGDLSQHGNVFLARLSRSLGGSF